MVHVDEVPISTTTSGPAPSTSDSANDDLEADIVDRVTD